MRGPDDYDRKRPMKNLGLSAILCLAAVCYGAAAEPSPGVAAVVELEGLAADPSVFEVAQAGKPIEIKSAEEAAKFFKDEALAQALAKVDFAKQYVLIFAWKGSGQDRLVSRVAESYPEQAFFELERGRTRDLRPHVRIYALRSNVTWKAK
jgi:hypothetical protein